jgi:hypothetical protein
LMALRSVSWVFMVPLLYRDEICGNLCALLSLRLHARLWFATLRHNELTTAVTRVIKYLDVQRRRAGW